MPFVDLIRTSSMSRQRCSMSIGRSTAIIRIGRWYAEQLGWEEDSRIMISVGTGKESEMMQLSRNEAGWSLRRGTRAIRKSGKDPGSSYILRFSHRAQSSRLFPGMPETMQAREIKPEIIGREKSPGGGLRFKMPWLPAPSLIPRTPGWTTQLSTQQFVIKEDNGTLPEISFPQGILNAKQ